MAVTRIRLGVSTRILGAKRLRLARSPAQHLSVRLLALRAVLLYLAEQRISYYRVPDDLLADEADGQLDESVALLAEVRALVGAHAMRLTSHPALHVLLSAPDATLAQQAAVQLAGGAALLDALGAGPEGVLVLHVGGAHGDAAAALERFAARFERLPAAVQRRVAVEPDEHCFDLAALLRLHRLTGVPIVFDALHHQLNNPQAIPLGEALGLALATWPPGVRAEVHFSTQRTEAHRDGRTPGSVVVAPRHGQHADYLNPFEFAALGRAARGLPPFDVMLEAKAGDLALLRLRDDLARFAPDVAQVVG